MSHRLFGTDGVRGKAGEYPLDHETVARLGGSLVRAMQRSSGPGSRLRFVVGRDTRESGEWIERELARGVHSAGAEITSAGVIPTPAIAYVTRAMGFDAGLVISASHNPFEDNGIKVFSGRGEKFTEALEREVETIVHDRSWSVEGTADAPVDRTNDRRMSFRARLALPEPERLGRFTLAIARQTARRRLSPKLFRDLGFDVHLLGAQPDGRNINLTAGRRTPSSRGRFAGSDAGWAWPRWRWRPRAISLTHKADRRRRRRAPDVRAALEGCRPFEGQRHCGDVMSNIGLEIALRQSAIDPCAALLATVRMEEMIAISRSRSNPPHHLLRASVHRDGTDGAERAARDGRESMAAGGSASELVTYPQVLVNVRVREKQVLADVPSIASDGARRSATRGRGAAARQVFRNRPLLRVSGERTRADSRGGRDRRSRQGAPRLEPRGPCRTWFRCSER
jgi:phosphoglucosamine mutase